MEGKIFTYFKMVLLIAFIAMVIWGQRQVGYGNLAVMLIGLGGLLGLLYSYNKKYK